MRQFSQEIKQHFAISKTILDDLAVLNWIFITQDDQGHIQMSEQAFMDQLSRL